MPQRISFSLRFRFFTALGGLLLCAIVSLGAISKWLIFPALQSEERLVVQRELDRVERSLRLDQQQLHAQVRDWAHWDDTYQFIQGNYPHYTETNFSKEMFDDLNRQLMAYFKATGEVYFLAGVDPTTGNYQACPTPTGGCAWMVPWVATMQAAIANGSVNQSDIYVEQIPSIVSANPILRTDESGPSNGWLFTVHNMNGQWLEKMSEYTGLPIKLRIISNAERSDDLLTFSGNTAHAQRYFPLYSSASKLVLGIEINRTSYLTSLTTFRYVLLWTAGLMLLSTILVLLLLEHIVLKPLRLLTQFTQQLDFNALDPNGLTQRNDEIGVLSRAFQNQFASQQQLNAELLKLSTHDSLTGLPNRRLFDQRLEYMVLEAGAKSTPLAVIMLDIDHFKLYNDHYGHLQGDECLRQVAEAFVALANAQGLLIARTGGEEFSVILPNATKKTAIGMGKQLIEVIDQLKVPHEMSPVSSFVTISVGIGMLEDTGSPSTSAVMSIADQALYAAKDAGRHCVKVYTPSLASAAFSSHNTLP